MIIEAIWQLVRVKHVVSMRQVNPNKASKEKTTITCSHIIKTTHDIFKGSLSNLSHLRQVMLQKKTTKHTIKTTSSMTCKCLSRSLNKLHLYHYRHETFSLFQHHSNLFEATLWMKTNIDQWSKYTLIQRYNKI
jgi:hypothetical protein